MSIRDNSTGKEAGMGKSPRHDKELGDQAGAVAGRNS
jgi:hypothetical protein